MELQEYFDQFDHNFIFKIFQREFNLKFPFQKIPELFLKNYEYNVFRERNLNQDKKKFKTQIKLETEITITPQLIEDNCKSISRSFTFRFYSLSDEREKRVPKHCSIPHLLLSVQSHIECSDYSEERLLAWFDDRNQFINIIKKEFNRDPNEPLFIVWCNHDPRNIGDNYSEVYEEVAYIGPEDKAMELYRQRKNASRFAGNSSTYYSYPQKLDSTSSLEVGDKKTIYPAKNSRDPIYDREIEDGY